MNYGKDVKLNCAEALAGALYLAGFDEQAETVLDVFRYGPAFFAVNEFHFSHYKKCSTAEEMKIAETLVKSELEKDRQENRNRAIDYGPGSSSSDDEGENDGEETKDQDNKGDSDSGTDDSEAERLYYASINQKIMDKHEDGDKENPE